MVYDIIPSDDFSPPPMISDACRVPPMIPDAFGRGPEPGFRIFPISFRLPLSTNQKDARTMVTQVPPIMLPLLKSLKLWKTARATVNLLKLVVRSETCSPFKFAIFVQNSVRNYELLEISVLVKNVK